MRLVLWWGLLWIAMSIRGIEVTDRLGWFVILISVYAVVLDIVKPW